MKEDVCGICGLDEPPQKTRKTGAKKKKKTSDEDIGWIGCDSCNKWFHTVCVRISPALLAVVDEYCYLCEKCSVIGTLLPKSPPSSSTGKSQEAQERIDKISSELARLQSELQLLQVNMKKQLDRFHNRLQTVDQEESRRTSANNLVENIEGKLELIKTGAKLASTCAQNVNCCRIAINKVPLCPGENVRSIVEDFLGIKEKMSRVTACFRLPVNPSKWTDRNLTPTILVAFDSREVRSLVLKRYFEKHKDAKLCNLKSAAPLEYRFTVNEMLSIPAFRIRNLALRLKQRKAIQSIFVRNDKISVRLPGQKRYVPVGSCDELLKLTGSSVSMDESSMFFDAVSSDISSQQ